ncbi:MAG: nucleotidyltransferase family protein [Kofleriaceae bacterium]|nr:nucleotidyltransferase family protein [Kofleriaceae bacterium]
MKEACIILAAGKGSRYGGQNKALLLWQSQTFLARIVQTCRELSIGEILVVIAEPHREATDACAKLLNVNTVVNPNPAEGMASSVSVGFQYALRTFLADAAWLWPVDSPAATSASLAPLQEQSAAIAIPVFGKRGGHPMRVARSVWPELAECHKAEEGARTVIRRDPRRVVRIAVEDARICQDIDSPEDWRHMQ